MQPDNTTTQVQAEKELIISLLLHDLRPPLQVLRFLTGHLSGSQSQGMSLQQIQGYLQELNVAVEELVQSSAAIFTWLEVQRDRFQQTAQPIAAAAILEQAVAHFRHEVPQPAIQLQLEAPPERYAKVDSNAVTVALHQLLRNAVHANPGGPIQMGARVQEGHLWLTVHDAGKGMNEKVIANIQEQLAGKAHAPVLYRYGYRIIIRVLQLLGGKIQFDITEGTKVSLGIPVCA